MKRNKLSLILLTLLVITLFSSGFFVNVKAISDVNYTFQNNELYNENNPSYDTFNLENETIISGIYNATYSFESGIGSFVDYESGEITSYSSSYAYHDDVLYLESIANDYYYMKNYFVSAQTANTIEFWINPLQIINPAVYIYLCDGDNVRIKLMINNSEWQVDTFANSWTTICPALSNIWQHVKIYFICLADTFDFYLNSVEYSDLTFDSPSVGLDNFRITLENVNDRNLYIDAVGYFGENYEIGDNLEPNIIKTDNLIVSSDEFAFDENGINYETEIKDACGWEGNNVDYTYLIQDPEQTYDRYYKIHCYGSTANRFIRKYYDINDGFFNFTLKINYLIMLNIDSDYYWAIYSTLTDIEAIIKFTNEAGYLKLYYCNDIDLETYTLIGTLDDTYSMVRELTLSMDLNNNCYFTYEDDYDYFEVSFPKTEGINGLYEISFAGSLDDTSTYQMIHIDNIGVFCNYTEFNDDFGINFYDLNVSYWKSIWHNLLEIDSIGFFSIGVFSEANFYNLRNFDNRTGSFIYNIYNQSFLLYNPYLAIMTNQSFIISKINIYGVNLTDGTTTFIPDFYYGYVDIDESYFYVDSSNRLQFNLVCNDNYTEFIELRFFLLTKTTENRSLSFRSVIDGVSQGYVHLAYWGFATTDIYFPPYLKTTTVRLPQVYIIYSLSIIISDLDITWYDNCNGYITNLKLLHSPGVGVADTLDISISALVIVIIPLIVLLAPTLVVGARFGGRSILPMFIFMSLICVITGLIPIWLFFIIALSSGALLFGQKKRGE